MFPLKKKPIFYKGCIKFPITHGRRIGRERTSSLLGRISSREEYQGGKSGGRDWEGKYWFGVALSLLPLPSRPLPSRPLPFLSPPFHINLRIRGIMRNYIHACTFRSGNSSIIHFLHYIFVITKMLKLDPTFIYLLNCLHFRIILYFF